MTSMAFLKGDHIVLVPSSSRKSSAFLLHLTIWVRRLRVSDFMGLQLIRLVLSHLLKRACRDLLRLL